MKNVFVLLCIVLFFSCAFIGESPELIECRNWYKNFKMPEDCSSDTIEGSMIWVHENIKYEESRIIQFPNDTLRKGEGDCADRGTLLSLILRKKFGFDVKFIIFTLPESRHLVLKRGNKVIDCGLRYYDSEWHYFNKMFPEATDVRVINFDKIWTDIYASRYDK